MTRKFFWGKRIKDTKAIANKLNVEETKIKELTSGEREIEGETFNKVLKAIEEEKINNPIKKMEILQWYRDTDLKKLREKFGYATQIELAKELGVHPSTICNFEKKQQIKVVSHRLIQLYDFFQNDFNKKTQVKEQPKEKKTYTDKEIYNWYKKIKDLREYSQKFGYSKNKLMSELNLSYDQIRDFEGHNYKSATSVVKKAFNFYHDENNRRPEIKISENLKKRWDKDKKEKADKKIDVANYYQIIEPDTAIYSSYNNDDYDKDKKIKELEETIKKDNEIITFLEDKSFKYQEENEKLKLQITRYEKLIDRI